MESPHSGNQEAASSKSTARHAAEMLRKSSRQHRPGEQMASLGSEAGLQPGLALLPVLG